MTQICFLNSGADVKGGSKNVEIAFFIIIIIRCDVFVPVHTKIVSKKILLLKQHSTRNILGLGIFFVCFRSFGRVFSLSTEKMYEYIFASARYTLNHFRSVKLLAI